MSNITLEETTESIINDLLLITDKDNNFEREELKQLLAFVAYESLFIFDERYYTQIDGAAMESPLGLTLGNAFLYRLKKNWPSECIVEFLLNLYKEYIDGIFLTFNSYTQLLKFMII